MMVRRVRTMPAGFVLGIAVAASCFSVAATAQAAPARPAATGSFKTWTAAQSAAKFKLVKPSTLDSLHRTGGIEVSKCEVTGELSKRLVTAAYGRTSKRLLSIEQNDSGGPCGDIGVAKNLGRFKVDGVWAHLLGECGLPEVPGSCHARDIWLFLTWTKNHVFFEASSHDEFRATIVSFSRGLVPVS